MKHVFMYIGGLEFDETELPAAVSIFGHKFIQEQPKSLSVSDFKSKAAFDHAMMKLATHPHFRELNDDVQEVIAPKKTWSRKAKPKVEAEDAVVIEDAAE